MFKYKIDVLKELKSAGYNTTVIRKEKLLSESSLTEIRSDKVVGLKSLGQICMLLNKDVGDIITWEDDDE